MDANFDFEDFNLFGDHHQFGSSNNNVDENTTSGGGGSSSGDYHDTHEAEALNNNHKDAVLFIVDCHSSMFEPNNNSNKRNNNKNRTTPFQCAMRCIYEFFSQKLLTSPKDFLSIVLYNSREQNNKRNFPHLYVFHDFANPSLGRLREIETLVASGRIGTPQFLEFEKEIGFADLQPFATKLQKERERVAAKKNIPIDEVEMEDIFSSSDDENDDDENDDNNYSNDYHQRRKSSSSKPFNFGKYFADPLDPAVAALREPPTFSDVLWAATTMFQELTGNKTGNNSRGNNNSGSSTNNNTKGIGSKRIFLWTNDDNPARGNIREKNTCETRMKNLCEMGVEVSVFAHAREDHSSSSSLSNAVIGGGIQTLANQQQQQRRNNNNNNSNNNNSNQRLGVGAASNYNNNNATTSNTSGSSIMQTIHSGSSSNYNINNNNYFYNNNNHGLPQQNQIMSDGSSFGNPTNFNNNNNSMMMMITGNQANGSSGSQFNNNSGSGSVFSTTKTSIDLQNRGAQNYFRGGDGSSTDVTAANDVITTSSEGNNNNNNNKQYSSSSNNLRPFNPDKFWNHVIDVARDVKRRNTHTTRYLYTGNEIELKKSLSRSGRNDEDGADFQNNNNDEDDEEEQRELEESYFIKVQDTLVAFEDFVDSFRNRVHPKRSLGTLQFFAGPMNATSPSCVVSLYAPIMKCTKPSQIWVEKGSQNLVQKVSKIVTVPQQQQPPILPRANINNNNNNNNNNDNNENNNNNENIAESNSQNLDNMESLFDLDTNNNNNNNQNQQQQGMVLNKNQLLKVSQIAGQNIPFFDAEIKAIKTLPAPDAAAAGTGIVRILQFKKAKKNWLPTISWTIDKSAFLHVHPSKCDQPGRNFFVALWSRLVARDLVAIAEIVARSGSSPRLCILIPATEKNTIGIAVAGSGFHVKYLPYCEDYRLNRLQLPAANKADLVPPPVAGVEHQQNQNQQNAAQNNNDDDDDDDDLFFDDVAASNRNARNLLGQNNRQPLDAANTLLQHQSVRNAQAMDLFVQSSKFVFKRKPGHEVLDTDGGDVDSRPKHIFPLCCQPNPALQSWFVKLQRVAAGTATLDANDEDDFGFDQRNGDGDDAALPSFVTDRRAAAENEQFYDFGINNQKKSWDAERIDRFNKMKDMLIGIEYQPQRFVTTTTTAARAGGGGTNNNNGNTTENPSYTKAIGLDWRTMHTEGTVGGVTIPVLQCFLRAAKLPTVGNKADLVARINTYFANGGAVPVEFMNNGGARRQRGE